MSFILHQQYPCGTGGLTPKTTFRHLLNCSSVLNMHPSEPNWDRDDVSVLYYCHVSRSFVLLLVWCDQLWRGVSFDKVKPYRCSREPFKLQKETKNIPVLCFKCSGGNVEPKQFVYAHSDKSNLATVETVSLNGKPAFMYPNTEHSWCFQDK